MLSRAQETFSSSPRRAEQEKMGKRGQPGPGETHGTARAGQQVLVYSGKHGTGRYVHRAYPAPARPQGGLWEASVLVQRRVSAQMSPRLDRAARAPTLFHGDGFRSPFQAPGGLATLPQGPWGPASRSPPRSLLHRWDPARAGRGVRASAEWSLSGRESRISI